MISVRALVASTLLALGSCVHAPAREDISRAGVWVARQGDALAFAELRGAFRERNPGYDVELVHGSYTAATDAVVFVQSAVGRAEIAGDERELTVGDVIVLRSGEELRADTEMSFVAFQVDEPFPAELPSVVRPDWDPRITDTPGGCATETGAYRRICLTWLEERGPYIYRGLNAHRVRIENSFTHYHPREGGFDEFYLVQMSRPGARLWSIPSAQSIATPGEVSAEQARELFHATDLRVGDLIYIPRETVHRGVGGALVHVIAVPGFRPGAEIGVDEELAAINARLGLSGSAALPVHVPLR